MKYTSIVVCGLLCLLSSLPTVAQTNYLVLKVKPLDQVKANRMVVKAGDRLKPNANIVLPHKGAQMFLRTSDCFYTVSKDGVLKAVLGECRSTQPSGIKRGLINSLKELQELMSTPKFLVIDTFQLSIPLTVLRLKAYKNGVQSGFMFLEVSSSQCPNGMCLIPVEVGESNSFLLHEGMLKANGKPIDLKTIQKIEFKYAESDTKDFTIAMLDAIFLKTADLREEVKALLESIKDLPTEQKAEQVQTYLSLAYGGTIDFLHLKQWLAKNFGL